MTKLLRYFLHKRTKKRGKEANVTMIAQAKGMHTVTIATKKYGSARAPVTL